MAVFKIADSAAPRKSQGSVKCHVLSQEAKGIGASPDVSTESGNRFVRNANRFAKTVSGACPSGISEKKQSPWRVKDIDWAVSSKQHAEGKAEFRKPSWMWSLISSD